MGLNDQWAACNARITTLLTELYDNQTEPQRVLFDAMEYSLTAGGKRLRPFLVYAFCALGGGTPEQADHAAMAVEMIHTYSLIHDDLPCMDNDDYRRGKLTNHKVYGEAMAVLAGDGLLTDAFYILTQAPLPPKQIRRMVQRLSYRAGPYGMVGGQALDMNAAAQPSSAQYILAIQQRKTGALIRAACELGALCAGGSQQLLTAAGAYADAIGLAFQIQDDILDATGDPEKLGKAVGVDEQKQTFVKLWGLARCREKVHTLSNQAIAALYAYDNAEALKELATYLASRDH